MTTTTVQDIVSSVEIAPQGSTLESLDALFKERVLQQRDYSAEQRDLLERTWHQIRNLGCQNAGVSSWGEHLLSLNSEQIARIQDVFDHVVVGVEARGLSPFPRVSTPLQHEMSHLFQDVEVPFPSWRRLSHRSISAMFLTPDPALMEDLRIEISAMFHRLLAQIQEGGHDPKITEQAVGHLIGMLPFFSALEGFETEILQKIGDEWRLVRYRFSPLQLTHSMFTSPVFAYGLTPVSDAEASPLLLFHGTPPPTISGSLLCYISDFFPGLSVGESIYIPGREAIAPWIEQQSPDRRVQVYGISLGGSLAYHVGREFGDRVEVHTFVPPGLFPWTEGSERIHGETYCHARDPISLLAFHPESPDFHFYRSFTDPARSLFSAHARASGGYVPTVLAHVDSRHENERFIRKFMIVLHQAFSIPFFIFTHLYMIVKWMVLSIFQLLAWTVRQIPIPSLTRS